MLAGDVADPVFGDARAVGYVDLVQPDRAGSVEADDVTSVQLRLRRDYVYGDTTTALTFALREVEGSWQPTLDYPADTLFDVGPVLATATTSVADTLVTFDLPASWVEANADLLVGDAATFGEEFEGFALVPTERPVPGAVFGFSGPSAQSGLRVIAGEDTLRYPIGEVFSSVAREEIALPPTFVPAQVNSGRGVRLRFSLDGIGPLPVARATLRAPVVASLAEDGPFVRPLVSNARLFGVDGDERVLLADLALGDDAVLSGVVTAALQQVLVGDEEFEAFEVEPAPIPASLDVLPVVRAGGAGEVPRLTLTVIGGPTP